MNDLGGGVRVDPGYSVGQERLAQFSALAARQAPQKEPLLAGLPRLEPRRGTRSFDIHGETRSAYEEVARQFGLTAAFDADLAPRPVRLRVTDVDFETMTRLLGDQTRTFLRPLNSHLFFVAEDDPSN